MWNNWKNPREIRRQSNEETSSRLNGKFLKAIFNVHISWLPNTPVFDRSLCYFQISSAWRKLINSYQSVIIVLNRWIFTSFGSIKNSFMIDIIEKSSLSSSSNFKMEKKFNIELKFVYKNRLFVRCIKK